MKGPRVSDLLALCCVLLAGCLLFATSQGVQSLERKRQNLLDQRQALMDDVRLLEVEWTLLNRPDRLAALAARELGWQPADPQAPVKSATAMTARDEAVLHPAAFHAVGESVRPHAP